MAARTAEYSRRTGETSVRLTLNLDGEGKADIDTGIGFADHMLNLLTFWGGFDLNLTCSGDLEVDAHHSLEDVGICLGQAIFNALGDRKGIRRVGFAKIPMDEARAEVVVDLSGRPYLVYDDPVLPAIIAGEEKDVWREFFKSVAFWARMNLHIRYEFGSNGHHLLESAFKGLGMALREAVEVRGSVVPSTKGSLD